MRRTALVLVLLGWPAWALHVNDRVDDFELLDHAGAAHELYYLSDARAVVLLSHRNACPGQAAAVEAFIALRDGYEAQGVAFLMIGSSDARTEIAARAEERGIESPVLVDDAGIVGESLGFERAGEAMVVSTDGWKLAWRGAPTGVGVALDAVLKGGAAPGAEALVDVAGCAIGYPQGAPVSYSDTIAPLLADNCVTCHREGGIGPWAMTDYNMVRGFSPMIREVIRTRRMPPWHADPMHGEFANDRSLEPDEIRALVAWIDAGSPRGDGPDPLAELEREWPVWEFGEPDLVIEIPSRDVPASGVVEYQYPVAMNPLDRDVWVRATEILPGDRQALHHARLQPVAALALLSVPSYDFNWQTSYVLREPRMLPAGTRIVHTTTWDNSAQNPANPDPNREVPWGLQSWDEMLFGSISFRYLEENETDDSEGLAQFQSASAGE